MVEYLVWMDTDLGFRDNTSLIRFFCRYLQSAPLLDMDEKEIEVKYTDIHGLIIRLPSFVMNS
jgi:hypothetical protein